jgi:hypothetical protein
MQYTLNSRFIIHNANPGTEECIGETIARILR